MIKLIASDLDGTLMQEDHMTVSEENKKALREAKARGITIVLASGRTIDIMEYVADAVGCVDYMIGANGAVVVDNKTKERWERTAELPPETAGKIFDILSRYPVAVEVYCGGKVYTEAHMKEIMKERIPSTGSFVDFLNGKAVTVECLGEALKGKPIEKFNVGYVPEESREEIEAEVSKIEGLITYSSFAGNLEINNINATKGAMLKHLCDHLGIDREDVLAVGDANNDIQMLQFAGHSFAMGNASEDVKSTAKNVTAANEENGVAKAIQGYL